MDDANGDLYGDAAGTGGLTAEPETGALDVPNGLGALSPKVRAGGDDGLDPDVLLDPKVDRAGDDEPNADPLDDGAVAGFINSPKRVGGGSCRLGDVGAFDGGGIGERTGADAALAVAVDVELMVAAAGCDAGVVDVAGAAD